MPAEDHTKIDLWNELLIAALRHRICPLCSVLQDKTHELLCNLQSEAVHNPEVNALVLSAGGYCHFHFWYLERLASAVSNAELLKDLLNKVVTQELENAGGGAVTSFGALSACPVCSSCRQWEDKLLIAFAERILQPEFRAAYDRSRGLCLPHLGQVLKRLPCGEPRDFLVTSSRCQLDRLIHELSLLVTKWRQRDHSPGAESDSTFRAIGKLVGGKHYRI